MTWTRAELKSRAKTAFKRNYWKCVLVAFIISLVSSNGGSNITNKINYNQNRNSSYDWEDDNYQYYYNFNDSSPSVMTTTHHAPKHHDTAYGNALYDSAYSGGYHSILYGALGSMVMMIVLVFVIVGAALSILVFNPLQVGGCAFFLENAWIDSAGPGHLLHAFKNNYKTTILTMFLRNLYIGLWSLLLVIPGIVKAYEYRMIPYLLADHPEMSRQDAFYESKRMMTGYKMEAFVLDLSFIGWAILSACTFGLLGIFYVNPYIQATDAELYLALKRETPQRDYV